MSWFKQKKVYTVEQLQDKCDKCKVPLGKIISRGPYNEKIYCDPCNRIALNGYLIPQYIEHFYIWDHAIEEKGVGWFKKARDKLIKRLDGEREKRDRREKLEHQKMIKRIEAWK